MIVCCRGSEHLFLDVMDSVWQRPSKQTAVFESLHIATKIVSAPGEPFSKSSDPKPSWAHAHKSTQMSFRSLKSISNFFSLGFSGSFTTKKCQKKTKKRNVRRIVHTQKCTKNSQPPSFSERSGSVLFGFVPRYSQCSPKETHDHHGDHEDRHREHSSNM